MTTWAHVDKDGSIVEHGPLPQNWRTVSNLPAAESDTAFLESLGWYPVLDESLPIQNDLVEYHGDPSYSFDPGRKKVIKVCQVLQKERPLTPELIFADNREKFMNELRSRRNELLVGSDWTQLADVQRKMSAAVIKSWDDYRQNLRDLPSVYAAPPLNTTIDIKGVVWPAKPVN